MHEEPYETTESIRYPPIGESCSGCGDLIGDGIGLDDRSRCERFSVYHQLLGRKWSSVRHVEDRSRYCMQREQQIRPAEFIFYDAFFKEIQELVDNHLVDQARCRRQEVQLLDRDFRPAKRTERLGRDEGNNDAREQFRCGQPHIGRS